jgi:aerobic C4-dicarboxylate transport protein
LVGTLSVVPTIPVAGMALILGIDRFMSEVRALVNVIGNGVATIVISRTEGELDLARLNAVLDGRMADAEEVEAPAGLVEDNPLPARHQA